MWSVIDEETHLKADSEENAFVWKRIVCLLRLLWLELDQLLVG